MGTARDFGDLCLAQAGERYVTARSTSFSTEPQDIVQ